MYDHKEETDQHSEAELYRASAEYHKQEVKSAWGTFWKSGVFVMAALGALLFIGLAWFMNNSEVRVNGINISADREAKYVIASAGSRQTAEQEKFKENGINILTDTDGEEYSEYYDTQTGESVALQEDNKLVLYKGTAWHLQDNGTVKPGARGVLEFYVIPQADGLGELTFTLHTAGYRARAAADVDNPVELVDEMVLNELLDGHILFFTNLDDVNGYSGWLGTGDKKVVVKAKEGDLQKNLPYKVSIYWIWPRRYRNLIYHQKSTHGDLFASESEDYTTLISFINNNPSKFFYNNNDLIDNVKTEIDMDDNDYARGTSYYNIADEYIGNNVNYIYVEVIP